LTKTSSLNCLPYLVRYERGGRAHVAEDRVTASVCGNGDALHERSAAWLRDQGIREVAKASGFSA
jgi:hypothetical protein